LTAADGEAAVGDAYLPTVYRKFRDEFPGVAEALDGLGEAVDAAGPLDERSARLVKLGLAIGAAAEGSVRSNTRKALAAGATPDEVRQVALLAITTCGFPLAIAGAGWIDEVLAAGS
jgi:alkylhydroperoxidase/carboxymuconolactone decarboxylase family protein YurZ